MDVLNAQNLTKKFSDGLVAVDNISFSLKEGEILGLLGPNGAGKTTTIQMLLGITTQTAGSITYFGKDFSHHRQYCLQRINFASAFNTLQKRITVWENLIIFAHLYQIENPKKKIKELIQYFEVEDIINQRFSDISSGQKTRVNIIKSLLNDPKILLMDEPTASLDPDIADKMLTLIEILQRDNHISILYTSHNMYEVTRICDRVIFLDHGVIVAHDTPVGLTKRIQTAQLKLSFKDNKDLVEKYCIEQVLQYRFEGMHVVYITADEDKIPKLIFGISKIGIWMTDIEVKKPTLEHVFLQIARGQDYVFK